MAEPLSGRAQRDSEHDALIQELIVQRGLSYRDALAELVSRRRRVVRPYDAAIAELCGWLGIEVPDA